MDLLNELEWRNYLNIELHLPTFKKKVGLQKCKYKTGNLQLCSVVDIINFAGISQYRAIKPNYNSSNVLHLLFRF